MGIFPSYQEQIDLQANSETYLPKAKDFAINFDTGELIIVDGDFVVVEEDEAIKVWCYYAMKAQKGRFLMYPYEFGNSFEDDFVGKAYDESTDKKLDRMIKECLLQSKYIKSVDKIDVSFDNDELSGTVELTTVYSRGVVIDV